MGMDTAIRIQINPPRKTSESIIPVIQEKVSRYSYCGLRHLPIMLLVFAAVSTILSGSILQNHHKLVEGQSSTQIGYWLVLLIYTSSL